MNEPNTPMVQVSQQCTAFAGTKLIAAGALKTVALETKKLMDLGTTEPILVFDNATSQQVEIDFRGSLADVSLRLERDCFEKIDVRTTVKGGSVGDGSIQAPLEYGSIQAPLEAGRDEKQTRTGPGRPKLGVVAREITLLPRHWDWLNNQPGGASVAIRKLVETAKRESSNKDAKRRSQEVTYRFMSALAGNSLGFEEATRALFAGDRDRFKGFIQEWPVDVRQHIQKLAVEAFS